MTKVTFGCIALSTLMFATSDNANAQDCNANFSYTQTTGGGLTISFEPVDPSTALGFRWSFGDDSGTSESLAPIHTFAEDGIHNVCLTVYTSGDSCTVCTDICVGGGSATSVGSIGLREDDINVYPNPSADFWNLDFNLKSIQVLDIQVADVTGKIVYRNSFKGKTGKNSTVIPNKNFAAGLYFVNISNGNEMVTKKATKL